MREGEEGGRESERAIHSVSICDKVSWFTMCYILECEYVCKP